MTTTSDPSPVESPVVLKFSASGEAHFERGTCADAYTRLAMPGWGLEQPFTTHLDAADSAAKTKPVSVDLVVAAFDRPVAGLVGAVLGALPSHATRRRVFLYYKRDPVDLDRVTRVVDDLAALDEGGDDTDDDHEDDRRRRAGRRTELVVELDVPNVGRCDHTYLHHVVRQYADLADLTLFVKDTTAAHGHLGQMANVLTFAAELPSTTRTWCVRAAGHISLDFELPEYKSEQCWRFNNCYRDEAYLLASHRPLRAWLDRHVGGLTDDSDNPGGRPASSSSTGGGGRPASSTVEGRRAALPGVTTTSLLSSRSSSSSSSSSRGGGGPHQRGGGASSWQLAASRPQPSTTTTSRTLGGVPQQHGAAESASPSEKTAPTKLWVCLGGIFAASQAAIRSTSAARYRSLLDEVDHGNSLEAGHYMERSWLYVFGERGPQSDDATRVIETRRTSIAVYTAAHRKSELAALAAAKEAILGLPRSVPKGVACVLFSSNTRALSRFAQAGWTTHKLLGSTPQLTARELKLVPHRFAELAAFDVTVYVEPGKVPNMPAIAAALGDELSSSRANMVVAPRRVCCVKRHDVLGALRFASLNAGAPHDASDRSKFRAYSLAKLRAGYSFAFSSAAADETTTVASSPEASSPSSPGGRRHKRRAGGRSFSGGLLSTACVMRRATRRTAAFNEAWYADVLASSIVEDDIALHFVRQSRRGAGVLGVTDRTLVLPEAAVRLEHAVLPATPPPPPPRDALPPGDSSSSSASAGDEAQTIRTWVFVATDSTDEQWISMTKHAVLSAHRVTRLQPICVFWGSHDAPLARWLEDHTSTHVIYHSPLWQPYVREAVAGMGKANLRWSPLYGDALSLTATFLRLDIPALLRPSQVGAFVLYTDTDVLFLRDPTLADFGTELPRFFTVGTEADPVADPRIPGSGNAGVMLLNLHSLRRSYADFLDFVFARHNVDRGLHFGRFGPGDQGAYNAFYEGQFAVVSWPVFNWKPYWPLPEAAPIDSDDPRRRQRGGSSTGVPGSVDVALVHFHGPKPWHYRDFFRDGRTAFSVFQGLFDKCGLRDHGCRHWLRVYDAALGVGPNATTGDVDAITSSLSVGVGAVGTEVRRPPPSSVGAQRGATGSSSASARGP